MYLMSVYSSIPCRDPSRPRPDSLIPPNAASGALMMPSFTPTMPTLRELMKLIQFKYGNYSLELTPYISSRMGKVRYEDLILSAGAFHTALGVVHRCSLRQKCLLQVYLYKIVTRRAQNMLNLASYNPKIMNHVLHCVYLHFLCDSPTLSDII